MKQRHFISKLVFLALFLLVPFYCFSDSVQEAKEKRERLVNYAKTFIGVPYVYGGTDKTGIDCSGLIYTVARESIGFQLPRTVAALYGYVEIIPNNQKEPGDILFFKTVGDRVSHAGIYIGNNQFIHAASDGPNTGVILSSLNESYWKQHYYAAGRFLPATIYAGRVGNDSQYASNNSSNQSGSNDLYPKSGPSGGFLSNLKLDISGFYDWNLLDEDSFAIMGKGFTIQGNVSCPSWFLQPGLSLGVKFDPESKKFQIPLALNLQINENVRIFGGPLFSFNALFDDLEETSFLCGILGVSWQSPSLRLGSLSFSFVQDISYIFDGKSSDEKISLYNTLGDSVLFSSGLKVTFFK